MKLIKQTNITRRKVIFIRGTAVLLALITTAIFIYFLGHNPIEVYVSMMKGAFGSSYKIRQTIIKSIPLVITSLGIMVAFKMKFWNIGAEGQILMGAFGASYFALFFGEASRPVLLLIMTATAIISGGLWALIPAYLKVRFNTNETIVTLMMNYIALQWVTFLQYSLWKDPAANGFPKIAKFSENGILPNLFGIHAGWIIAVILIIFIHLFMSYSKLGYEISVVGESENTAKYAGMNVKRIILISLFISGGLSGLTGMIQASAVNNTLSVAAAGGVGFTAIITTWLSGLSAPIATVVCILFAALLQGGAYIQITYQIPEAAAQILQSMILFFVLGSEFFTQYRIILPRKQNIISKEGVSDGY